METLIERKKDKSYFLCQLELPRDINLLILFASRLIFTITIRVLVGVTLLIIPLRNCFNDCPFTATVETRREKLGLNRTSIIKACMSDLDKNITELFYCLT